MNLKKILKSKSLFLLFSKNITKATRFVPFECEPGIYPFPKRQVPLDGLKTFDERLQEIQKAKSEIELESVNIGYRIPTEAVYSKKEKNANLENLARKRQLKIDIYELDNQLKNSNSCITRKFNIATFYNIYKDLFHSPHFFYSIKHMELEFDCGNDLKMPIYNGNLISPSNATAEPTIGFESEDDCLWTLVMSSPDEHLEENGKEYIHWMITNIAMKDSILDSSDCMVPYMQPIPYLGTGFHRYVFVLYKQIQGKVDLSDHSLSKHCSLQDRTFSSYQFLRDNQDLLTPVSLSFFQAAWDPSVRQYFRETLNCLEPLFEYQWPREKLKPMKQFPEDEVMHTYFDQYRDVKDIEEEVLKERLKTVDPFKEAKRLEFPLAVPSDPNEMIFVKKKFEDKEMRRNQWKAMDIKDDYMLD